MAKSEKVERLTKKSEYELRFASVQARRGWTDLTATTRNSLADSWDFLTRTPTQVLAALAHLKGDARIWLYVVESVVFLEQVHTSHPNETKR